MHPLLPPTHERIHTHTHVHAHAHTNTHTHMRMHTSTQIEAALFLSTQPYPHAVNHSSVLMAVVDDSERGELFMTTFTKHLLHNHGHKLAHPEVRGQLVS